MRILLLTLGLLTAQANAQLTATPSVAQIEQFKKLPKSQQEALAKRFGFDLSILNGVGSVSSDQKQLEAPEQRYLKESEAEYQNIKSQKHEENELKPFGYDLFENMQDAFLPQGNIPVPADYIIGAGDSINLALFGKESQDYTLEVNNEGKITIPGLEPITVVGMTYSELKEFIAQTINTKMIGMKSVVSIADLRSIQVYVLGDVKKPGAYLLSSLSTVSNALFISGGATKVGSLRNIQLKRAGDTKVTFDLYDFMLKGNSSSDIRLQQGDVVYVAPVANQVTVMGEVRRPAIYEVKLDETIGDVIDYAGGLTSEAYNQEIQLKTYNDRQLRKVLTINYKSKSDISIKLKDGDVLNVFKNIERLDQAVTIAGYASRPGSYSWTKGTTLNSIIKEPTDLLIGADFNYGLIISSSDSYTQSIQVKQFSPSELFKGNTSIELKKNDLVLFFGSVNKESYYSKQGLQVDDLEVQKKIDERLEKLSAPSAIKEESYRVALDELSALYGDAGILKADESRKKNYLFKILLGSLKDKQQALTESQSLSRQELLFPIKQIIEQKIEFGNKVNLVEVRGEVRFPGVYPINGDSTLIDAIYAAGGVKESASLYRSEVSRFVETDNDSRRTEHQSVNLGLALVGNDEEDIKLEGRDIINVFKQANWNEELKVTLEGEVRYPGEYTLKEKETLKELIERAGGLTELAAVEAAFFTRESLKELEKKQARDMARMLNKELALKSISSSITNINVNDVNKLVTALSETTGVGRLVIDLEDILVGARDDIKLENGDKLIIPRKRNEVNVIGEVQVATSHMYNSDWTADKYIRVSGGYRAQADEKRVYIIRANGLVDIPDLNQWFGTDRRAYLKPGDTIVVPLDADYTDKLTLWEKATSIFYQMTVGLAALGRL